MGGKKSLILGTDGRASDLEDGTLGRFLGELSGVVDGWTESARSWGGRRRQELRDWAWRKVGIGHELATGDIEDIQRRVDLLTRKAMRGQHFSEEEKSFVVDLYEWIAAGGRWRWVASSPTQPDKGLWEAGELLRHYLHGSGETLKIDAHIYETSAIVKYAMAEMRKVIASDLRTTGTIRRNGEIWSTHVLKRRSFGDVVTRGQVLEGGVLLAEQQNARLKYANHRFVLRSKSLALRLQGKGHEVAVVTTWRVEDSWDYSSFSEQRRLGRNDVTHLPVRGGKVLRLPDGLSQYLTHEGLAQEFTFYSEWTERWAVGEDVK
jgi:hypothetical protein